MWASKKLYIHQYELIVIISLTFHWKNIQKSKIFGLSGLVVSLMVSDERMSFRICFFLFSSWVTQGLVSTHCSQKKIKKKLAFFTSLNRTNNMTSSYFYQISLWPQFRWFPQFGRPRMSVCFTNDILEDNVVLQQ